MIPMPLAAAHTAFLAWRARAGTLGEYSPAALDDGDLADLRLVVARIYQDVRDSLDLIDTTLSRRVMARSPRSGPGDGGESPPGPDLPPGPPELTPLAAPGAIP